MQKMSVESVDSEQAVKRALAAARETRFVSVAPGARREAGRVFEKLFGGQTAIVVADANTFAVAGRDALDSLRAAGQPCAEPFVFTDPDLYAEYRFVERLRDALARIDGVAVAVGSGTINDLTKRASHELGRPYMAVATAASMDGYTAYGASITLHGKKDTLDCPAPAAVLADLDVIARAPEGMNASGYADLLAKAASGADWLVADAAGVEPIEPAIWEMVQGPLPSLVADPGAIRQSDPDALRRLICGLLITGFAMQAARSSRPASGADHQFSHLWDMQHHTHNGHAPSHGFKVGIGTLASAAFYGELFKSDEPPFQLDAAVAAWPTLDAYEAELAGLLPEPDVASKARDEIRAKHCTPDELRGQLTRLQAAWPALRARLGKQLPSYAELSEMLRAAGCPHQPEQIGITRERLRRSYRQAFFLRRRFTILDVAERAALFEPSLDALFAPGGAWATSLESTPVQGALR